MKTLLQQIANALVARQNCLKSGNTAQADKWEAFLAEIERSRLPSGSGIDAGTKIDLSEPRGVPRSDGHKRIVLTLSYHHMNDGGMYDGWTEHEVRITPDLLFGYKLHITGPDCNGTKEYLADVFSAVLDETAPAVVAE